MFSKIRKRFTYANVVMTLALVFAMSGGAYAAKRYLITSTSQINPKVLAKLKGNQGKAGVAGLAGPTGPAGPQGPAGTAGKDGVNGVNGASGGPGESVTAKAIPTKVTACKEQGGSEFKVGTTTTSACNGQTGFTETLPSGKTEQGVWASLYTATAAGQNGSASISFNIPLAKAPVAKKGTNFIGIEEGEGEPKENKAAIPSNCKGTVADPKAIAGNLCVFVRAFINAEIGPLGADFIDPQNGTGETAGSGGAVMDLGSVASGLVFADGVWVVTAE